MWKRENETTPAAPAPATATPAPAVTPAATPRREPEPPAPPRASEPATPATVGRASIGGGTVVRGEISGEEDLLVEGRVEGKIDLKGNSVTVGPKGRLSAEVHARAILIDGEVDGNLTAPRVTIEDGARFKGSIDMEPKRASASASAPAPMPARSGGKGDPVASLAAAAGSSS